MSCIADDIFLQRLWNATALVPPLMRFDIVLNNGRASMDYQRNQNDSDLRRRPLFTPLIFVRQSSAHSKLPWHCPQPNLQWEIPITIIKLNKLLRLLLKSSKDASLAWTMVQITAMSLLRRLTRHYQDSSVNGMARCSANVWFVHFYWYVRI